MDLAKALLEWLWRRLGLPLWPIFAIAGVAVVVAAICDWRRHRVRIDVLRTLAWERKSRMVRGWRFWSPALRSEVLELTVSPMRIAARAPTPGRLRLDSRDIPDRHVRAKREERFRSGDWAFDEAFDAVVSSKGFGEAALDGDVRSDLLKLDALARRASPEDEEGKSLHRLRVDLDGRRLEARFRHALEAGDIAAAVDLLERLARRLGPPPP